MSSTLISSVFAISLLSASLVSADTNPNAQGACEPTTETCGPNGSEEWLNSGLSEANGWNPPYLDINSIVHINRDQLYGGVGGSCSQYNDEFQSAGDEFGIDPTILAFIALQESSCNADAGGPTPGLMQVDPGNCLDGASSCQYPILANVRAGASYLRDQLNTYNNNIVHAIGVYNGWFTSDDGQAQCCNNGRGLTEDYPCTVNQNYEYGTPQNLDYLHQTLNGWFQGLDPYDSDIGYYKCDQQCGTGPIC
ncbi:glycoside hydrolase family 23 protein [Polychaeton citri CBS 116435]|uniref:Glycoside hydrolase family 23 protein n=1 Tax=Polychaeton citri CBS 116435 TaxID=1314669 RepID=A0A9P4Q110_9PEZI|nr:glycoside hydrolase family 23 protein [Polychaeton citri CBS 116435]